MKTIQIVQLVLVVLQLIAIGAYIYFSRKATKLRKLATELEAKARRQQETAERELFAAQIALLARGLGDPEKDS